MHKKDVPDLLEIENAAHHGAFGRNRIAEPTENQCNAGNYKMGRVSIYGLPVAIEQPRGAYRNGIDTKTGKKWVTRLDSHYGYINGTKGKDGDCVDCFIGFYPQSDYVYVINQVMNGRFDEHKSMLLFPDQDSAKRAYLNSYERGWGGMGSIAQLSINQFKWWLKNGDMSRPVNQDDLPPEGMESMKKVYWDNQNRPVDGRTLDRVLYEMRQSDEGGLMLDSVSMAEIIEDSEGVLALDALVSAFAKLERKMSILQGVMERARTEVKPVSMQVSDPFKQNGVANVAVIYEMSDGQTITIYFHNPDVTPQKMAATDEIISWKWMLNKKDITIVVAPERGRDLDVREVARRIIKLAEKNSSAFARANQKKAERMQEIQDLKDEIVTLETELKDAQNELEALKIEAEDRSLAGQQSRISDVYKALGSFMWEPRDEFMSIVLTDMSGIDIRFVTGYENGQWVTANPDAEVSRLEDSGTAMEMAKAITESANAIIEARNSLISNPDNEFDPTTPEGYAKAKKEFTHPPIDSYVRAYGGALNSVKLRPLPGKSFTDEEASSLIKWLSENGWSGSREGNYVLGIGDIDDVWHRVPEAMRITKADLKAIEREKARDEKENRDKDEYDSSPAKEWIEKIFGNATNQYNKRVLARYLDNKVDTYFGDITHKWVEPILGILPSLSEESLVSMSRDDLFPLIKDVYESSKNDNSESEEITDINDLVGISQKVANMPNDELKALRRYSEGSDADMKSPLQVTFTLDKISDVFMYQIKLIPGAHEKYKFLKDKVTKLPGIKMKVGSSGRFQDSIDLNNAIRGGKEFGYFEVSPRKGYTLITLVIDLAGKPKENNSDNAQSGGVAEETKRTSDDVNAVMPLLKQFIGKSQLSAVGMGIRGEEKQFFIDKMLEIANTIQAMPQTYGQDGMGDKAVVYLHYFKGSADWYITEKDMEDEQLQTFGLADPFGDGGELGYISIQELIDSGVELDFYWTPKTIGEIKGSKGREIQETADVGDKSYADKNNNESLEMMKSKVGAKVEWWMAGSVKRTGVIVDAKKVESEFQFEDEVKHELVYVVKPDSSFKTEGETINFAPSEITFIENNLLGSGHDASRSFLQSVINGTADMDSKTFANEIEKAAEQLGDDNELVIQAANVYADYVTKKSKELLQ